MTTVVINNGFTTRTSSSGRARVTIDCKSEPLVHNLDPKQLGAGPAAAIAQHLRDRIRGIVARASDATLAARRTAAARVAAGEPDALRRYGGGRMGVRVPNQSDRLFNDSGRLVESIVARANGDAYTINVAGNRLDEASFGSGFAAMLEKLASFVPEIRNPRLLMDSIPVRRAIQDGMAQMIQKQSARIQELRDARARAIVGAAGSLLRLIA